MLQFCSIIVRSCILLTRVNCRPTTMRPMEELTNTVVLAMPFDTTTSFTVSFWCLSCVWSSAWLLGSRCPSHIVPNIPIAVVLSSNGIEAFYCWLRLAPYFYCSALYSPMWLQNQQGFESFPFRCLQRQQQRPYRNRKIEKESEKINTKCNICWVKTIAESARNSQNSQLSCRISIKLNIICHKLRVLRRWTRAVSTFSALYFFLKFDIHLFLFLFCVWFK